MSISQKEERNQQAVLTTAYAQYERGLRTHVFFKIRNGDAGEDLLQDTFMKAWLYLRKGGKIEKMKSFLFHILNNLIIDEYRRHAPVSLDTLLEKGYEFGTDTQERFIDMVDAKAALRLLQYLPKRYQGVMRMRYVQDLPLEEIAHLTGQSKNTVAVQLHRGLVRLRGIYAESAQAASMRLTAKALLHT